MSLIESMRRRMMSAEEHDVPRQSFIDSELQSGLLLQDSASPIIRAIGKEHTLAAMSLARADGWPTSAYAETSDIEFSEPMRGEDGFE